MQPAELARLVDTVQRNCDLADAAHAREKSLCTYLLGMREYFRWAEDLPLDAAPDRARLSDWITRREQAWDDLRAGDEDGFAALPLADAIDPFDEARANEMLAPHGLAYGAGVGLFGAPLFFLGMRRTEQRRDGATIIVADRELARGFTAPPAASRGATIVIRLDALRRWLWTRAEGAQRNGRETTFAAALRAYASGDGLAGAVEAMAQGEVETMVLHELGERRAAPLLGAEWEEMLAGVDDRRAEMTLRALRDLLADCLVTLPALIERAATASLLFWYATFDGLRRELAPALTAAYSAETTRVDLHALERAVRHGREQWLATAEEMRAVWRRSSSAGLADAARRLTQPH